MRTRPRRIGRMGAALVMTALPAVCTVVLFGEVGLAISSLLWPPLARDREGEKGERREGQGDE